MEMSYTPEEVSEMEEATVELGREEWRTLQHDILDKAATSRHATQVTVRQKDAIAEISGGYWPWTSWDDVEDPYSIEAPKGLLEDVRDVAQMPDLTEEEQAVVEEFAKQLE